MPLDTRVVAREVARAIISGEVSLRDTANGVAALDSTGNLLAQDAEIKLKRNASNVIAITERIAGEVAVEITRVGASDFTVEVWTSAAKQRVQIQAAGAAAARPGSGTAAGQQYFATDTNVLSIWTGAAWKTVTLA